MSDQEFREVHESIIAQYPAEIQREFREARERFLATNRRLSREGGAENG